MGVAAYSNEVYVVHKGKKVVTGMIGMPSEYCRRYLITHKGVTFPDYDRSAQYWELEHF